MSSASDITLFKKSLGQEREIRTLPDEIAFSPPVPLADGKVVVYLYNLRGHPPNPPAVSVPKYRLTADYPSGKLLSLEAFGTMPADLAPKDGVTLGIVNNPPEYKNIPFARYNALETEFNSLYSVALDTYFANRPMDPGQCKRLAELLTVFGKAPLIPLLERANPLFFKHIRCG